jgi:hypothetical protein
MGTGPLPRALNDRGVALAINCHLASRLKKVYSYTSRGVHRVLVGKPEGKRILGRPRRRWEDNIKMDCREVGGGCGTWRELA